MRQIGSSFVILLLFNMIVACSDKSNDSQSTSDKMQQVQSHKNARSSTKILQEASIGPRLVIKSYDWQGKIPLSKQVIIENPYGSIRSRNHSQRQIFLHATYQMIGKSPLTPQFIVEENDDWLKIVVVYDDTLRDNSGQLRGRTDVSILFPADVSIVAQTTNGLVKVDKSSSHVKAITQSGRVSLDTRGLFSVTTGSGQVDLKLRGQKSVGQSIVATQTGAINAVIFNDMSLDLKAQSGHGVVLNGQASQSEAWLKQRNGLSRVNLRSNDGTITIKVVQPPALVQSILPTNATSVDIDLRQIKKTKPWQPGDPIYDRGDKIRH